MKIETLSDTLSNAARKTGEGILAIRTDGSNANALRYRDLDIDEVVQDLLIAQDAAFISYETEEEAIDAFDRLAESCDEAVSALLQVELVLALPSGQVQSFA